MDAKRRTVFISYSWDSEQHKDWVLKLANDLVDKFGINVLLDRYELNPGNDFLFFMESSIVKADKVLVILTPTYKRRAEERKSGVGYETSMITQEIFESDITKVKFLPILREGTSDSSSPKFLKSKIYHEMTSDDLYMIQLDKLARLIYDKPSIKKPELGEIPNFSDFGFDPIISKALRLAEEEQINNKINQILYSQDGVSNFEKEASIIDSHVQEMIKLYNETTSIHFIYESNHHNTIVLKSSGYSVSFLWDNVYSNTASEAYMLMKYWDGGISLNETGYYFPGDEPKVLQTEKYSIDMDYEMQLLWRLGEKKFKSGELVQSAFAFIINRIEEQKRQNFRR